MEIKKEVANRKQKNKVYFRSTTIVKDKVAVYLLDKTFRLEFYVDRTVLANTPVN